MWKFDLFCNTWEQLKIKIKKIKEKKESVKKNSKEINSEEKDNEDEELDDKEEGEKNKNIKHQSGHSMVEENSIFYILREKIGLIKKSNEIWKFIHNDGIYKCLHETLLGLFTIKEL